MEQYAGLIELVIFYGAALGGGFWMLRSNAKAKRELAARRAREAEEEE